MGRVHKNICKVCNKEFITDKKTRRICYDESCNEIIKKLRKTERLSYGARQLLEKSRDIAQQLFEKRVEINEQIKQIKGDENGN